METDEKAFEIQNLDLMKDVKLNPIQRERILKKLRKIIPRQIIKRYDLLVTHPGQKINKTITLEKDISEINGIFLTSDKDDLLFYRGMVTVKINKGEYFPKGYESNLLMSSINIPPSQRFFLLDCHDKKGFKIKLTFIDRVTDKPLFENYRVSFYFRCTFESEKRNPFSRV